MCDEQRGTKLFRREAVVKTSVGGRRVERRLTLRATPTTTEKEKRHRSGAAAVSNVLSMDFDKVLEKLWQSGNQQAYMII